MFKTNRFKKNREKDIRQFRVLRSQLQDNLLFVFQNSVLATYSCFDKGSPTKPYATMPKGIMGSEGSWSLIAAEGVFSDMEGNSTNK